MLAVEADQDTAPTMPAVVLNRLNQPADALLLYNL